MSIRDKMPSTKKRLRYDRIRAPVALAERLSQQRRTAGQMEAGRPADLARPDREIRLWATRLYLRCRRWRLAAVLCAPRARLCRDHGTRSVRSRAAIGAGAPRRAGRFRAMDRGGCDRLAVTAIFRHLARPRRVSFSGRGKGPHGL